MDTGCDPLLKVFVVQLKRLRTAKGWTQEALGTCIGFSGEMVSKVESGRNRPSGRPRAGCWCATRRTATASR